MSTSGAGAAAAAEKHQMTRQVPSGKSPVYQIDFAAVACGSRIASTKRKIRWRFGFTNTEALEAGLQGQDCRGEEHDISLVWSIASGKRVVHVDQQEIHYSNSRSGTFEFSWTMRGNHVLKIKAHASPPISSTPDFRQYDFYVDGQSFFTFPKVYRLNMPVEASSGSSQFVPLAETGRQASSDQVWKLEQPQNAVEEEAILREILEKSKVETAMKKSEENGVESEEKSVEPPANTDLLDLFGSLTTGTTAGENKASSSIPSAPSAVHMEYQSSNTSGPNFAHHTGMALGNVQRTNLTQTTDPIMGSQMSSEAYANIAPVGASSNPSFHFANRVPAPSTASTSQTDGTSTTANASSMFIAAPQMVSGLASGNDGNGTLLPSTLNSSSKSSTDAALFDGKINKNPIGSFNKENSSAPSVSLHSNNSLDLKVGNTLADQAYMKIANGFTLNENTSRANERVNPFDEQKVVAGPQPTLEGLKTSKPESERKEVMKQPPQVAGEAIVLSTNQQGNWGNYHQYSGSTRSFNVNAPNHMNYNYGGYHQVQNVDYHGTYQTQAQNMQSQASTQQQYYQQQTTPGGYQTGYGYSQYQQN